MGVTIPHGFGQMTLKFRCNGVQDAMVCTIGYDWSGNLGDAGDSTDGAAHLIVTTLTAPNRPFHAASFLTSYRFDGVDVTENHSGEMIVGSWPANIQGSLAGPTALPPNCSILIRKQTNVGGRRGRGRMYLPPMHTGEGQVNEAGIIQGGDLTAITNQWQSWREAVILAGLVPVLLHSNAPDKPDPLPTPITSFQPQSLLATQRRRMR